MDVSDGLVQDLGHLARASGLAAEIEAGRVPLSASAARFWPAEDYHQDYFELNPHQGYCAFVVAPKVQKFVQTFVDRVKCH
jgi:thiamine monophosphate kinase